MSAGGSDRRDAGAAYPFAVALAALAGAVDTVAFLHWRGLFVSFMSGNSTMLGAASARLDAATVTVSLGVIGGFVAGVAAGELLAGVPTRHARSLVLATEAVLLAAGAALTVRGAPELLLAPGLSVAMGIQNAAVHRAGGISVAVTYVTGTLVNVGRSLAAAARGTGPWTAALPYLGLWCGLVGGSLLGALGAARSEPMTLLGAAAAALLLAGGTALGRARQSRSADHR